MVILLKNDKDIKIPFEANFRKKNQCKCAVEYMVKKYKLSFFEACEYIIERYGLEPKSFFSKMPNNIKEKIKNECVKLHKVKK